MHVTTKKTNTIMEVQIHNSTTISSNVKPYELPLDIFDRLTLNAHVALIYAFTPPTPSNSELIRGLREALVHFPNLTARLKHNSSHIPCSVIIGQDKSHETGGALLVEAEVNSDLAKHLPLMPSQELLKLHPPCVQEDGQAVDYALQVQLNRFKCGGLVIGITNHHMIADGQSMFFFFTAWGQAVRGVSIDPLPDFDQSWLKPRNPTNYELFKHLKPHQFSNDGAHASIADENIVYEEKNNVANILLHFSEDFVKYKLKSKVKNDQYTTFEILTAYLWKKVALARGLEEDMVAKLVISVNCRQRMKPPVSCNFFGNLVTDSHIPLKAKEVAQGSLDDMVKIVRDAIKRIDDNYIRSMIDFGEVHKDEDIELPEDPILLEVDSWRRFGLESVDFWHGSKLCAVMPSWIPVEGVMILLPSFGEERGVNVILTLPEKDAENLKRIYLSED